MLKKSTTNFN